MNETFCTRLWHGLNILVPGTVKICCWTPEVVQRQGRALTVYEHSVEDIWNSTELRAMRQAMIEGRKLSTCQGCYDAERVTGTSQRTISNENWLAIHPPKQKKTLEQLAAETVAGDYRVQGPPRMLHLEIGNACNLKCRMCSSGASSRIASDPVHRRWAPPEQHWQLVTPTVRKKPKGDSAHKGRFDTPGQWFQQRSFVEQELLPPTDQLRSLYLIGGEPLIIPEFERMLDYLIGQGMNDRVSLFLSTNGTVAPPHLLAKLSRFCRPQLFVSADGFGSTYEYIRFPGRWETVEASLSTFRQSLPDAAIQLAVTVQAYNVLDLVTLYRYCDSIDLPFTTSRLTGPAYLDLAVVPPVARRRCVERLQQYLASDCRPMNRAVVEATVHWLQSLGNGWDRRLVGQFMTFTNDLDRSRGQSIKAALPELYEAIVGSGRRWSQRTRYLGEAERASASQDGKTPAWLARAWKRWREAARVG